jgi:hypothetical protein
LTKSRGNVLFTLDWNVAVILTRKLPVVVESLKIAVDVIVAPEVKGTVARLKETVSPPGPIMTGAARVMFPTNPPKLVSVTFAVPVVPWSKFIVAGVTEKPKSFTIRVRPT